MPRIFTFVLATLLVVATPVTADHASALAAAKGASKPAKTTVVDVDRPTVIVFAPPRWVVESNSDKGAVEMIAHVRFAVEDVNNCKGASPISVRMVFADRLAFSFEGRRTVVDLSRKFPDSAGAYLVRPGRKPCAIATPNDTAFLGDLLSRAVGEFFDVPGCREKGSSDVCRARDG
jgi:hypothetical protein